MLIGGTPETSVMNVELSGSQIWYSKERGGGCELLPKCPHRRNVLMNTQKERKSCVYVEAEGVCDLVSTTGCLLLLHHFPLPPTICSSAYGSWGHIMQLRSTIAITKPSCFSNSLCHELHGFIGLLYNCFFKSCCFYITPI